jgi:hypothetical protein
MSVLGLYIETATQQVLNLDQQISGLLNGKAFEIHTSRIVGTDHVLNHGAKSAHALREQFLPIKFQLGRSWNTRHLNLKVWYGAVSI